MVADATLFAGGLAVRCEALPEQVTWKVEICRREVWLSLRWEDRPPERKCWTWELLAHAAMDRLDLFAAEAVEELWRRIKPPAAPELHLSR